MFWIIDTAVQKHPTQTFKYYSKYSGYRMTTIQISKQTKGLINTFGTKEDTYENIIKRMYSLAVKEQLRELLMSSKNSITGNFKLVLARYLHIYGDMEYQRNVDNSSAEQTIENSALENTSHPMKIHRRMRSKELHYIDHPLVGILIQINPVNPDIS